MGPRPSPGMSAIAGPYPSSTDGGVAGAAGTAVTKGTAATNWTSATAGTNGTAGFIGTAGDKARGQRVARKLEAGAVNINDSFSNMFNFALPMGGWKQSGSGARWGGASGVRKYCRQQAITVPRIPTQKKELLWFPYSATKFRFALGLMRAAAAQGKRRFGFTDGKSK